ncbi:hypothetical protein [Streptomyces himalayensis]|uniref:Uncharacterized protein n=1 Tax=Streptomyces himalayensis subsp. himalayensis TaxID=2756131 RepID=A0A7W0DUF2_9ACTN|nr:hypothetical protein [Streptomyces himalayensis]MBA2951449.1 hypothetical protein [Streptomyces himalayensis subsp. himalayensis]
MADDAPESPKPGKRIVVRVDVGMARDLAVLMAGGANVSDAVRRAVRRDADNQRKRWQTPDRKAANG